MHFNGCCIHDNANGCSDSVQVVFMPKNTERDRLDLVHYAHAFEQNDLKKGEQVQAKVFFYFSSSFYSTSSLPWLTKNTSESESKWSDINSWQSATFEKRVLQLHLKI